MKIVQKIKAQIIRPLIRSIIQKLIYLIDEELSCVYREKQKKHHLLIISRLQSCGYGVRLNGDVTITYPRSVCIGNNVHIGNNAYFSTAGGLTIGDNTHISRNVTIYTVNHNYEGDALPYDSSQVPKPVAIGKNVWIGMNVSIVPGVKIGSGAIIGMGSVITNDVPDRSIVGVSRQRIIKYRDNRHYHRLEEKQQYGGVNGELLSEESRQVIRDSYLNYSNADVFFVVSTGRCGSKTIANAMNQHTDIICYHEPRPQLIRLSTEYSHDLKTDQEIMQELRSIYCEGSTYPPSYYGESDQKLWNLIPMMNQIFPDAKIIWLIRDGRDFVNSSYSRQWFSDLEADLGNPGSDSLLARWRYYRLNGAQTGFFTEAEWDRLSVFERNCWYWYYVNKKIENDLDYLDKERWIQVKIEELPIKINDLFSFLGLQHQQVIVKRLNQGKSLIRSWENWNQQEKNSFSRWCNKNMDKWYPDRQPV